MGNPVLNKRTFEKVNKKEPQVTALSRSDFATRRGLGLTELGTRSFGREESMTMDGTIGKSLLLFGILLAGALVGWKAALVAPLALTAWAYPTMFLAFGVGIVLCLNPRMAPTLAPLYAVLEGAVVGGISFMVNEQYSGIVFNSVVLTLGILLAMLLTFKTGLFRPSDRFNRGVFAATCGVAILYIVDIVGSYVFHAPVTFIHSSGWVGIIFSIFVVLLATLNLLADFSMIEEGVKAQAPGYMEWYCSFGLLVTLVWLYLEILRLLSKKN